MSLLTQFKLLAHYNQAMNQRQYAAAALLSTMQLNQDQGAFFKSVIGTFNHILVGDLIWLKRFAHYTLANQALLGLVAKPTPQTLNAILINNLEELSQERAIIDQVLIAWINDLTEADLETCLAYKNMQGLDLNRRLSDLITHLFMHQVHHRGQVTTLLSQYRIDFGETDLLEFLDAC